MDRKVYVYKGKHYSLDASLTPAEAKAKIEAVLAASSQPALAEEPPIDTPVANPADYANVPRVEVTGGVNEVSTPVQQTEQKPENKGLGVSDYILSSPVTRVLKGAVVDPIIGTGQLLNNIGVNGMFINPINATSQLLQQSGLFGDTVRQNANVNENVRQLEQEFLNARAARGSTGFDWWQLAGNVASPINRVVGGVIRPDAGLFTKAGQGAVAGATLSATQPVADKDYNSTKAIQGTLGTLLGGGTQLTLSTLGKAFDFLGTLTKSGRTQALKDYIDSLAGDSKAKVIKALQDAQELVKGSRPTVAEALADIPSAAELAAAQAKVAGKSGIARKFVEREAEQQAARARALQGIAGTADDRAALIAERQRVTAPMREDALNQVDEAAKVITKLEKDILDGYNSLAASLQTSGMMQGAQARNMAVFGQGKPGWLSAGDRAAEAAQKSGLYAGKAGVIRDNIKLKEYQLKSLQENGFFPLKALDLVDDIDRVLKSVTNDESKKVLNGVKEDILSRADKDTGLLSSRDVYENIRKLSNVKINEYLGSKQFASGGIPEQAAKAATNVKNIVDAAFNRSSDGLWSKYINNYKAYSERLNRMEVGDYLSGKLNSALDKERAGVFATAVADANGTIRRATGIPRYERLDQILTKDEVATVNGVLGDLMRKEKAKAMSGKVKELGEYSENIAGEIPQLLSRPVAIGRAILNYIRRGNAEEFNKRLADLMLEPADMAKFMTETVPKGKINELTSAMMKMMTPENRQIFVQTFTVTPLAKEVGTSELQVQE